ncbi:PREDICTED: 3-ketodihydrosphingosine reductase [Nicrophorus vespilloides]|uniref:3-dehydrosphinganine reductase n=1 Tax=Nicrophorus vespilloides TaxID=110193 RepID=A0ABM1MNK0_NICVS|nr:PREDICTED: 3-ketodihydrosphingosine reductase [Nicrophorus vespilloides]
MIFIIFLPVLIITFIIKFFSERRTIKRDLTGKHVCITGGSSGIGKAIGMQAAQKGAHVTIIARNQERLQLAIQEIESYKINSQQKFQAVSVDCAIWDTVSEKIDTIDKELPIYMFVNCVGMAICGKLEDLSPNDIKTMIDVNLYGVIYPTRAIVPKMKSRNDGVIVITGSQGGLCGIFGYTVYACTKFALRGLSEALHMEVRDHNISITLALPADTNTPGFEIENESKPLETQLISESAGLYKPEDVAKNIIKDSLKGRFFSTIGMESWILTTLCVGMSPFTYVFDLILEALLLSPLRLISAYYLRSFQKTVTKCSRKNE